MVEGRPLLQCISRRLSLFIEGVRGGNEGGGSLDGGQGGGGVGGWEGGSYRGRGELQPPRPVMPLLPLVPPSRPLLCSSCHLLFVLRR